MIILNMPGEEHSPRAQQGSEGRRLHLGPPGTLSTGLWSAFRLHSADGLPILM